LHHAVAELSAPDRGVLARCDGKSTSASLDAAALERLRAAALLLS
jgi:hypothetical protein